MITSCKDIDITDWRKILPWVSECICRHKKRYDFKNLLLRTGEITAEEYKRVLDGELRLLGNAEIKIAQEAEKRIRERSLKLPPVQIREKQDHSSLKVRLIGKESAMQQIFDYIAVRSCEEIWRRRIIPQQASSIKKRGQVYGVSMISKWLKKDNRAAEYAHKHGLKYTRKCKYEVKLDVRKCYQSLRTEEFMKHFRRDCGNEDILWLWETLLNSHRVPMPDGTMYEGFMIGALPSQQAAQYLLSFVYRYTMDLHSERRGKRVKWVSRMLLFMDDMQLFGSSYKNLKKAVRCIEKYAREEIGIEIKPGWQIHCVDETPVDMMGYVVHADGNVTVRPRVFLRARRIALRANRKQGISFRQAQRMNSYKGFFQQKKKRGRKPLPLKMFKVMKKLELKKLFRLASRIISNRERRMKNADSGIQRETVEVYVHGVAGWNGGCMAEG